MGSAVRRHPLTCSSAGTASRRRRTARARLGHDHDGVPRGGAGRRHRPGAAADVSVLVEDGRVRWIGPADDEPDPGPDAEVVDCSGATIVPGLVDSHSHLTLPGGAHWIDRGFDPPERLLEVGRGQRAAAAVGRRAVGPRRRRRRRRRSRRRPRAGAGARGPGPVGRPPASTRTCARPAPGSTRTGALPGGLGMEVEDGDGLLAAALRQLDDGADLVKLYLDGPDPETSPFTVAEVRARRDGGPRARRRVAAHSGMLPGARVGAEAGVDSLEHGFAAGRRHRRRDGGERRGAGLDAGGAASRGGPSPGRRRSPGSPATRAEAGSPSGASGPTRACGWRPRRRARSPPAPTSAAGPPGPTSWPGRWSAWSRPASSRGRRWRRPPGTAGSCSVNRRRA